MTESMIRAEALSKSYPTGNGVSGLDWQVEAGSITGLVGPNGAGKTTILKMLMGVTKPTSGTAEVFGRRVSNHSVYIRSQAAFVPEDRLLYGEAIVLGFLRFYGSHFAKWDADAAERLLAAWEIPTDRKIAELSKGTRAKLVLAAALSRNAQLLLLDEPTIDLDPASVEEILGVLSAWVAEGNRTVVLATHRLEEVERICDSALIMVDGHAKLEGNLDELKDAWRQIRVHGGAVDPQECLGWAGVIHAASSGSGTNITVDGKADEVVERLRSDPSMRVEVQNMSLREIYLTVTNYERGRLDGALEGLV